MLARIAPIATAMVHTGSAICRDSATAHDRTPPAAGTSRCDTFDRVEKSNRRSSDERNRSQLLSGLADEHADVQIERHKGGQPLYPYLFGVE